ncbi:unnamed protein product [Symbiodinium microadriaticum]|nr:unnamed protein product [Symbiodinium microadriaticum]
MYMKLTLYHLVDTQSKPGTSRGWVEMPQAQGLEEVSVQVEEVRLGAVVHMEGLEHWATFPSQPAVVGGSEVEGTAEVYTGEQEASAQVGVQPAVPPRTPTVEERGPQVEDSEGGALWLRSLRAAMPSALLDRKRAPLVLAAWLSLV